MTDVFDQALQFTLESEGGYSSDKYDPGGQTKYGISKASYPHLDIYHLTLDQAKSIYRKDYWEKTGGKIEETHPKLAIALFDTAVNMGVRTANTFLQLALHTKADGIIGPMTLASLEDVEEDSLVIEFLTSRMLKYTELGIWHKYRLGWTRRVFKLMQYCYKV